MTQESREMFPFYRDDDYCILLEASKKEKEKEREIEMEGEKDKRD